MLRAGKNYSTFKNTRSALFTHSYAGYIIGRYIRSKYQLNGKILQNQIRKLFISKRSIPEISRLSKTLNLNYQFLEQYILLNKTKGLDKKVRNEEKVKAFLEIEKELTFLKSAREEKNRLTEEEYEYALLRPAIERASGNNLKAIEDDLIFEREHDELKKKFNRWYYDTAYRYKLPTPRIIPFILRLITTPKDS